MYEGFKDDIKKFNKMYGLPCNGIPTDLGKDKVIAMQDIIAEEVDEFFDILKDYDANDSVTNLVNISDCLGDIIVYCSTFAKQWGIDMSETLKIVMQSNFSKLNENGKPIKDERGKIMKGADYWKPEPQIKELILNTKDDDHDENGFYKEGAECECGCGYRFKYNFN